MKQIAAKRRKNAKKRDGNIQNRDAGAPRCLTFESPFAFSAFCAFLRLFLPVFLAALTEIFRVFLAEATESGFFHSSQIAGAFTGSDA